jgi:uncharacterized protein (TIGR02145 family)
LKWGGSSGFNALLGGAIFNLNKPYLSDTATFFWSSSENGSRHATAHGLHAENHGVSTYPSSKANSFYVRCIKD